MRTLSSTLLAAQKSPSSVPYIKVEVKNRIAGITRLEWERLYEGSEADFYHAATIPGDGSLIRFRIDPTTGTLYRSRVISPDENSDFSQWTSTGRTALAVACTALGAEVLVFAIESSSPYHIYRQESSDYGATWGGWTNTGMISDANGRVAATHKDNGDVCVIYSYGHRLRAERRLSGGWQSTPQTLHEYYNTGDDTAHSFYGVYWDAQTFTPQVTHQIASVKLLLYRTGNPGTVTVSIRATSGGLPTGADLASGTTNGNTLPDTSPGEWHTITFTTPITLTAGTMYAIVVRVPSGSTTNRLHWRFDSTSATYPRGTKCRSSDSGSSWTSDTTHDFMFEEYSPAQENSVQAPEWFTTVSGIALLHAGDWNTVVTGAKTGNLNGVWQCLFGDGYSQSPGTWSPLKEICRASPGSSVAFHFPSIDWPDVFRLFFVEKYSGSQSYSRPLWSHSLATAEFVSALWREPVPFDLTSNYGVAITHRGSYAWLSTPLGVWRAALSPASLDLTKDVVELTTWTEPASGRLRLMLRNDDGRYRDIGSGALAAIKEGSEILVSPGYRTAQGNEVSVGPAYWIEGWEYLLERGSAYLVLHAHDGWGLLNNWKARRQFSWNQGEENIFQLLSFIFARAGLEFSAFSSSGLMVNHYPAFTIHPAESGAKAVLRLLAMVPDVLFFRGNYGYTLNPLATDGSVYSYGNNHPILEGRYSFACPAINRVQVYGNGVMVDSFAWDEIGNVCDRLRQIHDLNLNTIEKAQERSQAELRHEAMTSIGGEILVPVNCGQELYDVIDITDGWAGLTQAKRRVLGLMLHYTTKGMVSRYEQRLRLGGV